MYVQIRKLQERLGMEEALRKKYQAQLESTMGAEQFQEQRIHELYECCEQERALREKYYKQFRDLSEVLQCHSGKSGNGRRGGMKSAEEEEEARPRRRVQEFQERLENEQVLRKKYHNQLQDAKGCVRIYARIRPFLEHEMLESSTNKTKDDGSVRRALKKVDAFNVELLASSNRNKRKEPKKSFTFDSVLDETSTQEAVFAECQDLVVSAMDGFNVTLCAYGHTGSGKTHTMYGGNSRETRSDGLVPRTVEEIFRLVAERSSTEETQRYQVRCSLMELYKDGLIDLLIPKGTRAPVPSLEVKRDPSWGNVFVENLTERETRTSSDLHVAIEEARARRHVSTTKMNRESSRSHLILSISLEAKEEKTKKTMSLGKITLCDLAGSERLKKSESVGEQVRRRSPSTSL